MTATDDLRKMLDERGVEWTKPKRIWWELIDSEPDDSVTIVEGVTIEAATDGTLVVYPLTPEQAIEATLGRGTCRDVRSADHTIAFECSECGCWVAYDEYWETGIYVPDETGQDHIHPRYCPNCGGRVEQ